MTPPAGIDATLRQAAESGRVPGVVAAAATAEGVVYAGAAGVRSLRTRETMTTDSVFSIASMTKAITAVAAMQCVERGKLALDQPAGEIVGALGSPLVLEGFDEDGEPRLRPAVRPVTLRLLLTHTSGFSYDTWNVSIRRFAERTGLPAARTGKLGALNAPLVFEPGERWEYGIGIDWVGRMIEAVSGERLDRYMQNHIFGPLGMQDTGYVLSDEQERRRATMHQRVADGSLEPLALQRTQQPEFCTGGGGLHATASDYLALLRMLLAGGALNGARILKPETVRLMAQNHIGELFVPPLRSAIPELSNDLEFFPGIPNKWGLSFLINTEDAPTGRSAGSLAWAGLSNCYFWLDPKRQIAGVMLTQILPFGDLEALALLGAFERAVYDSFG
jgi:methyl acetate hydrolase